MYSSDFVFFFDNTNKFDLISFTLPNNTLITKGRKIQKIEFTQKYFVNDVPTNNELLPTLIFFEIVIRSDLVPRFVRYPVFM